MLNLKVYFLHPKGNTRDDPKSMIKENISSIAAANCVHVAANWSQAVGLAISRRTDISKNVMQENKQTRNRNSGTSRFLKEKLVCKMKDHGI